MNHFFASPPLFFPFSMGAAAHFDPALGFSSVIASEPVLSSHFDRFPDSKSSAKRTAGSLEMPASPGYFAARPAPSGRLSAAAAAVVTSRKAMTSRCIAAPGLMGSAIRRLQIRPTDGVLPVAYLPGGK